MSITSGTTLQAMDDLLGLYLDSNAQSPCLDVSELTPGLNFDLYMVLQNATQPALHGFEAGVQFQPDLIGYAGQSFLTRLHG